MSLTPYSPRVTAGRKIKQYLNNIGISANVRSGMTKKKGVFITIHHDELPHFEVKPFHDFIDSIQSEYKIDNVTITGDLPF